ncbi:hypothetical protein TNIN_90781 [Trichonephila inaurata madagascariensis]|uniref:Uncharacterized protein n=1 Tax=Trichonephila inaurata madagascariensis TaxID=2747483 RepID=A0A8X7CCG9_9ARAC|nr:hypothetical protein TNIN_90781 [Trichonephila inaurata madagascariensis]
MQVVLKPIVSPVHLDRVKYFLEDQTIELLEPDLEQNGLPRPEIGNEIQTYRQRRKKQEKAYPRKMTMINLDWENVVENGRIWGLAYKQRGTDNGIWLNLKWDCEVMKHS